MVRSNWNGNRRIQRKIKSKLHYLAQIDGANMFWFTADEHYLHDKIIKYCNRPFNTTEEMNETLILNFNGVVKKQDVTVHAGDFGWFKSENDAKKFTKRLNGNHIFVKGSHDRWLKDNHQFMWRRHIDGQFVVVCHYALRTWERAIYGAWNLYGHSHGTLPPIGKQWDVGVDNNNFMPVSMEDLRKIMNNRENINNKPHGSTS